MQSFREMLFRNIDEFHALVRGARPTPDAMNDPGYQEQKRNYCELLKAATLLMTHMQKTLNEVLTKYRLFIETLWEAICADKDPNPISERFQEETAAYMKHSWDPIFAEANKMIANIEKSRKHIVNKK